MPLQPQEHIIAAIVLAEAAYPWHDTNVQAAFQPGDPDVAHRARTISHRARSALTIAIGEWITHALSELAGDHSPVIRDYLAALWVWNVDYRYVVPFNPDDREWGGPVLGALQLVPILANQSYEQTEEEGPTQEAPSWISQLARHVLSSRGAYDEWLDTVLRRLEEHHQHEVDPDDLFQETEFRGWPVPRALFDTATVYAHERREQQLDEFIKWFHADENPFKRPTDAQPE